MNRLKFSLDPMYKNNMTLSCRTKHILYLIDNGFELFRCQIIKQYMTRTSLGTFEYVEDAIQAAQEDWTKTNAAPL